MPQAATAIEVSRIFFMRWVVRFIGLSGGFVFKLIYSLNYLHWRRRNKNEAAAPRPPSAIAEGSGTGIRTRFPSQLPVSMPTGGVNPEFTLAVKGPVVPVYARSPVV